MNADEITEKVIGAAYTVANTLGSGFLEKVYENALAFELRQMGFKADLLVEDSVLVELKAVKTLDDSHMAQCLNYLHATGLKVCLLLNFGSSKVQVKRIVHKF